MKKFAFFLPQFHEIPENNQWWGDGFTEWTNVRKAKTYYNEHKQPKHPIDNNYYNLLNKNTVEWQTKLMKQYSVDGLIYYHYYFCGKKLLEKPAENLLKWKNIDQPFFFCWANHSWIRSWEGTKTVLIEQTYGDKSDWEKHFKYLLPFFKDERYEKIDNKPVFMLYNSDFKEKNEMLEFFNAKCVENGFAGLYSIECIMAFNDISEAVDNAFASKAQCTQSIFLREHLTSSIIYKKKIKYIIPRCFLKIKKQINKWIFNDDMSVVYAKADDLYNVIMHDEPKSTKIIHGLFFEWDNTPRHGNRGTVILPPTKNCFFELMNNLKQSDYVFINAWNEWCEGMILEPSQENGYKYLEWIKEWTEKND